MKNIFKIFKLILPVFALGLFFNSCEDKEYPILSTGTAPTIGQIPAEIVIDKTNVNSEKFTITFTSATYSTPVAIANQFEIARQGTNFNPTVTLGNTIVGSIDKSVEFTYKELNAALTNLGLEPDVQANIEVRLKTHATVYGQSNVGIMPSLSATKVMAVTPFEPQPAWIYSPGAYCGWSPENSQPLCSPLDNGIYVGYINFPEADSEFKFTKEKSWDLNWGSEDGATLVQDGPNVKSPDEGYHKITVDLITFTFAIAPYSWGIIGSATPTGWDSDTDMDWNAELQRWEQTIELTGGDEFKLRLNNDWDTNYGITEGVVAPGGDNIPIGETGQYLVTFDEVNLVITYTKL